MKIIGINENQVQKCVMSDWLRWSDLLKMIQSREKRIFTHAHERKKRVSPSPFWMVDNWRNYIEWDHVGAVHVWFIFCLFCCCFVVASFQTYNTSICWYPKYDKCVWCTTMHNWNVDMQSFVWRVEPFQNMKSRLTHHWQHVHRIDWENWNLIYTKCF